MKKTKKSDVFKSIDLLTVEAPSHGEKKLVIDLRHGTIKKTL